MSLITNYFTKKKNVGQKEILYIEENSTLTSISAQFYGDCLAEQQFPKCQKDDCINLKHMFKEKIEEK